MNMIRRWFNVLIALGCIASLSVAQDDGAAADPSEAPAIRMLNKQYVTEDLKQAVTNGLKRLSELQESNGAFTRGGGQQYAIAVTSLAGLALLASGSTPDKGPYSGNVRRAIDFLLSMQDRNTGYFTGESDGSRIHGHGYATLFLAQAYGSLESGADKQRVERSLQAAVERISKGQTGFGGWGYVPDDLTWDEASTTVCCIQALRAASDAGIKVEKSTIAKAVKYLYDSAEKRVFMHQGEEHVGYTFKYSLASGWNSDSYALVAAAISTMNGIGIYAANEIWNEQDIGRVYQGGLRWLRFKLDDFLSRRQAGQGSLDVSHFYYAHFYATQAMWLAPQEVYFDEYFPRVRELLVAEQKRNPAGNGGWPAQSYGEAYTTSFALLILQVPYQLLPLYAR